MSLSAIHMAVVVAKGKRDDVSAEVVVVATKGTGDTKAATGATKRVNQTPKSMIILGWVILYSKSGSLLLQW